MTKKRKSIKKNKKNSHKLNLKKYLVFSGIIVLCGFFLLSLFHFKLIHRGVRLDKRYEVLGVDVSQNQGKINWQIFENEEISFVFIKATEGENFIDKQYKNNRKEVEKTSIIRGYYHFFRFNKNGKKQAEFFIQNVPYKIGELYPCVDIETYGNKFHNKSKNEIIADIDLYIKTIKNYYGVYPIIYTNIYTYNLYIKDNFNECVLWICDLDKMPKIDRKWTFWQYSHKGKSLATKYKIDCDVFYGSFKDLNAYLLQPKK